MKKHLIMRINLVISLIIIMGFVSTSLVNYVTYSHVITDDFDSLIYRADEGLYKSKALGRNRVSAVSAQDNNS